MQQPSAAPASEAPAPAPPVPASAPTNKRAADKPTADKRAADKPTADKRAADKRADKRAATAARTVPSAARSKAREVAQILLMSLLSFSATLIAMWFLDLLSSGVWEGHRRSRAILSGPALALARAQLRNPTALMPPTFLAFYSEECVYCVKMRNPFLSAANAAPAARFVALKLDKASQDNVLLAKQFAVTDVPSVYFVKTVVDADGKLKLEKLKYEGRPRLWALRNFVNRQLEQHFDHLQHQYQPPNLASPLADHDHTEL